MKDRVLIAIAAERRQLKQRLAILAEIEARVREAPAPNGFSATQSHAPTGALRKAILASLKGAGAMLSIDLKKKVRAGGHRWKINGQVFTRTLRELSDEKAITRVENGSFSLYSLKRR